MVRVLGYKNIGVFIQNDAYGRSGADGVGRALKVHGLKIKAEVTYKRGAKYSASMKKQVALLLKKDVKVIVSIGSYAACAAFIRDARLSNFKGPIANISFVGAEALLKLLRKTELEESVTLTNRLVNSQVVPLWSDKSVPLVREYQSAMSKYAPKIPNKLKDPKFKESSYGFVSLEGYLNAKALVHVLKKSPKNITRKSFQVTIESMANFDLGLNKPLSFSKSRHQAIDTIYYTTVKNGKYTSIKNWSDFKQ